jgi:hypothetical protein
MLETDLREMDDGVGATDCDQQLLSGLERGGANEKRKVDGSKKKHTKQ